MVYEHKACLLIFYKYPQIRVFRKLRGVYELAQTLIVYSLFNFTKISSFDFACLKILKLGLTKGRRR